LTTYIVNTIDRGLTDRGKTWRCFEKADVCVFHSRIRRHDIFKLPNITPPNFFFTR